MWKRDHHNPPDRSKTPTLLFNAQNNTKYCQRPPLTLSPHREPQPGGGEDDAVHSLARCSIQVVFVAALNVEDYGWIVVVGARLNGIQVDHLTEDFSRWTSIDTLDI